VGLNGSFTLNADGTTSVSGGASLNASFGGWGGSVGINVNNDGTTSLTGSASYNEQQDNAWRDELSKEAAKNDAALAPAVDAAQATKDAQEQTKTDDPARLIVESVITGNFEGDDVLGKGMKGYENITYIDEKGNKTSFRVDNVKWGTMKGSGHAYDEPTNSGKNFAVSYVEKSKYQLHVGTPESGVRVHRGNYSAGCVVLGKGNTADNVYGSILANVQNGRPVTVDHSMTDKRNIIDKTFRPIYNNRDQ
jgi:hypothetical protein